MSREQSSGSFPGDKSPAVVRYPRSDPACVTRLVSEHDQPHIRSPFATAAPTSRLRRAGLRKTRTFLENGVSGHGLRPALPRRRGKAGISGDLSAVIELSGESLRPEDRSELRPNATDTQQHRRRGRRFGLFCVEQRVPLGLDSLDLLEQQFEPIEFSTNLGFEMWGQATAITSLERFQPRSPIATQRLIRGCAL